MKVTTPNQNSGMRRNEIGAGGWIISYYSGTTHDALATKNSGISLSELGIGIKRMDQMHDQ